MENQINNQENKKTTRDDKHSSLYTVVIIIFLLVSLMIASIYYPFPNGKSLSFWGFIALWFRELIIVGLFLILFIAWIVNRILDGNKSEEDGSNAP